MHGLYLDHEVELKVTQAIGRSCTVSLKRTPTAALSSRICGFPAATSSFCARKVSRQLEDFEGCKGRIHGSALSYWISSFGGDPQLPAFVEVYTALERGILDCGVTVAFAAHAQRWFEVANYMVGPLSSQFLNTMNVNRAVWDSLPEDI